MEVDDTIAMAEDKTVLKSSDDNKELEIMPSCSSQRHKRLKMRHDKEEPPGESLSDTIKSESVLSGTPMKLAVSASEDDDNDNSNDYTAMAEDDDDDNDHNDDDDDAYAADSTSGDDLPTTSSKSRKLTQEDLKIEYENVAIKRKRYEIKRSGSEECLLGFAEQDGEPELIKNENIKNEVEEQDEEMRPSSPIQEIKVENKSPKSSPVSMKKSPSEKSAASPLPKASQSPQQVRRSATKSPLDVKPKLPATESSVQKVNQKPSPKSHIVGDGDETNGQDDNVAIPTSPTVTAAPAAKKVLTPQDEFYKKPFEFGWKRELVWRSNLESSKDKADVYFISPTGKKLRGRNEIVPLLEDGLTIDHFCFAREALGAAPEFEIVRIAKPSSRASATTATLAMASTLSPPAVGKRVSKPKVPKGASPPPEGWTPSKALKVNNAALLSTSGGGSGRSSNSTQNPFPQNANTPPSQRRHHDSNAQNSSHSTRSSSSKSKKSVSSAAAALNKNPQVERRMGNALGKESCSVNCAKALGQVPQLQCTKCFCLFHHECVGIDRQTSDFRTTSSTNGLEYICEVCGPKPVAKANNQQSPSPTVKNPVKNASPVVADSLPRPSRSAAPAKKVRAENKQPQTIAVVKGKKYVMVAKPLPMPNEHVNDIENDLKQINESIRRNRKQSNNSQEGSVHSNHNSHYAQAVAEQSSKMFATNFFANVSYAYDSLLSVFKYLKIHERPQAAAVCKLWNLAARDTSLWQTVRMKNSKVCSWSGFAAALRRGETKHLDLRKMLLPSGRCEGFWNDFCENIGSVCSLEKIDLCRCSARVVDSLFQSNRNLKVVNALAINDDPINLKNVSVMDNLHELRLRACESAHLTGDMSNFSSLSKLTHLSLTSMKGLGDKNLDILRQLGALKSLELGECGDFSSNFSMVVLPQLESLERLRLENGQVANLCTLDILDAVARLENLNQLELVNFDIKPGFDKKLGLCINITKLLIIPTYISQSATTNHIVLSAVQRVAKTLKVFTWCVTVELLRVTALYVDQCEESTKKEKHHFDECIPVLKPVPGASSPDEDENKMHADNPALPQIEILPLDKVETILSENLPNTKFTIVKVPYQSTCKQQLVD